MTKKNRIVHLLAAAAAGAALASTAAVAQTLYKLIDKNGKVTYAEKPPKEGTFDGKVIRMDIDPNANTATLPKPSVEAPAKRTSDSPREKPAGSPAPTGGDKVQAAREKVDAAKKALRDAQDNPGENDVQRVGTTSGFTRPVPTEAYQQRLAKLEEAVRKAEDELRDAQR